MSVLRRSAAHLFVDDLSSPVPSDDDRHHLGRVLRLRDGESVTVSDGHGAWRPCVWRSGGLAPAGEVARVAAGGDSTVVFALSKGDKPELVVQKLTEVGVTRIVPVVAERSVVRWDDAKSARNAERLRRVAREAAMQSRRCSIPEVTEVVPSVAEVVGRYGTGFALAEPGAAEPTAEVHTIAVGPEGGFTDDELALAPLVGLPGGVLRAETAAIVAGVVLARLHGAER